MAILVLLLVVALAFVVIRHRQLQRSFMSFNSHYDTRSETATCNLEENTTEDFGKSSLSSKYQLFVKNVRDTEHSCAFN